MNSLHEQYLGGNYIDKDIMALYEALLWTAERVSRGTTRNYGICSLVQNSPMLYQSPDRKVRGMLTALFQTWDKYSGNTEYPVPSSCGDPKDAFYHRLKDRDDDYMWGINTEYGANRRDLLLHCINEVAALRLEIRNGLRPASVQFKALFNKNGELL